MWNMFAKLKNLLISSINESCWEIFVWLINVFEKNNDCKKGELFRKIICHAILERFLDELNESYPWNDLGSSKFSAFSVFRIEKRGSHS